MRLYTEIREFDDEKTGGKVCYEQVFLEVNGFSVAIKPVFKSDRRLLLALVGKE